MKDVEIKGAAGFLSHTVSKSFNLLLVVTGRKDTFKFVDEFLGKGVAPAGRLIRDYTAKLFFLVIPELLPNFISRACCRPPGFHLSYF